MFRSLHNAARRCRIGTVSLSPTTAEPLSPELDRHLKFSALCITASKFLSSKQQFDKQLYALRQDRRGFNGRITHNTRVINALNLPGRLYGQAVAGCLIKGWNLASFPIKRGISDRCCDLAEEQYAVKPSVPLTTSSIGLVPTILKSG